MAWGVAGKGTQARQQARAVNPPAVTLRPCGKYSWEGWACSSGDHISSQNKEGSQRRALHLRLAWIRASQLGAPLAHVDEVPSAFLSLELKDGLIYPRKSALNKGLTNPFTWRTHHR